MAFERLEPWGWPLIRVLVDWGRSVFALLCSANSPTQIDRDKMPDITVAAETKPLEEDPDPTESAETSVLQSAEDAEFRDAVAEPTSEDILRAMREQDQFRF